MCGENSPEENGKWYSSIVVWKFSGEFRGSFHFQLRNAKSEKNDFEELQRVSCYFTARSSACSMSR